MTLEDRTNKNTSLSDRRSMIQGVVSVLLILATVGGWYWYTSGPNEEWHSETPEELVTLCEGDQQLADRLDVFRASALDIGRNRGLTGLRVLDAFGDNAVYLYESKRENFEQLERIFELEKPLFDLSLGPWKEAIVDWAMSGKLGVYLAHLPKLDKEDRVILQTVPAALPLLLSDTPKANAMLIRYGERAWQMLQHVDLRDEASIERAAAALQVHGDTMLELNDQYGPCVSWLLIPPQRDTAGIVPSVFLESVSLMGVDAAAPLFLTNYDDIQKMLLEEDLSERRLADAFRYLATAQSQELAAWAADSSYSLRLLTTQLDGDPIGQQIMERCGPEAASLLYGPGGYGAVSTENSEEFARLLQTERTATLLVLRDQGWPAAQFLSTYQEFSPLRELLRREDLIKTPSDPLISKVVGSLVAVSSVESTVPIILRKPASQLLDEQYPEAAMDKVGDWIPGYTALKVAGKLATGYHVSGIEASFAIVDGVTACTGVAAIAKQAVKTTGNVAAKTTISKATVQVTEQSAKTAAKALASRVPGVTYSALKALRSLSKPDVTQLARSATETARKVGIRSWGKLDRRIIMRQDRRVVLDFGSKEFREELARRTAEETATNSAMLFAPLLYELTVPALQVN